MKLKIAFLTLMAVFLLMAGSVSAEPPVLQSSYGSNGVSVDLLRCKVVNNIVSLAFEFKSKSKELTQIMMDPRKVYYIADGKKYSMLKDEDGKWITSHTSWLPFKDGKNAIYWAKFPAPPENVKTIQINLPQIMPFEEQELQRTQ